MHIGICTAGAVSPVPDQAIVKLANAVIETGTIQVNSTPITRSRTGDTAIPVGITTIFVIF